MNYQTSSQIRGKRFGYGSAFLSESRFCDDKNFLDLSHFSGNFTVNEANILRATGYVMTRLRNGEMQPEGAEHRHFLEVLNGKQEARSLEEKTYLKYLQVVQNMYGNLSSANTSLSDIENVNNQDTDKPGGSKED